MLVIGPQPSDVTLRIVELSPLKGLWRLSYTAHVFFVSWWVFVLLSLLIYFPDYIIPIPISFCHIPQLYRSQASELNHDRGAKAEWSLALQSWGLTPPPLPYRGSSLFQSNNSLQAIAMSSILQIQISKLFPKDYHYLHFTLNKNIWEGDILEDENGRRNITSLFIIHSFSVGLATWKLLEANWGKKSNLMFLVNRQFPAYSSAADRKLLTDFSELVLIYISEFNCYMQKLKWWSVIKFL